MSSRRRRQPANASTYHRSGDPPMHDPADTPTIMSDPNWFAPRHDAPYADMFLLSSDSAGNPAWSDPAPPPGAGDWGAPFGDSSSGILSPTAFSFAPHDTDPMVTATGDLMRDSDHGHEQLMDDREDDDDDDDDAMDHDGLDYQHHPLLSETTPPPTPVREAAVQQLVDTLMPPRPPPYPLTSFRIALHRNVDYNVSRGGANNASSSAQAPALPMPASPALPIGPIASLLSGSRTASGDGSAAAAAIEVPPPTIPPGTPPPASLNTLATQRLIASAEYATCAGLVDPTSAAAVLIPALGPAQASNSTSCQPTAGLHACHGSQGCYHCEMRKWLVQARRDCHPLADAVGPEWPGIWARAAVTVLVPTVAPKSYGGEKRYMCPPPSIELVGCPWFPTAALAMPGVPRDHDFPDLDAAVLPAISNVDIPGIELRLTDCVETTATPSDAPRHAAGPPRGESVFLGTAGWVPPNSMVGTGVTATTGSSAELSASQPPPALDTSASSAASSSATVKARRGTASHRIVTQLALDGAGDDDYRRQPPALSSSPPVSNGASKRGVPRGGYAAELRGAASAKSTMRADPLTKVRVESYIPFSPVCPDVPAASFVVRQIHVSELEKTSAIQATFRIAPPTPVAAARTVATERIRPARVTWAELPSPPIRVIAKATKKKPTAIGHSLGFATVGALLSGSQVALFMRIRAQSVVTKHWTVGAVSGVARKDVPRVHATLPFGHSMAGASANGALPLAFEPKVPPALAKGILDLNTEAIATPDPVRYLFPQASEPQLVEFLASPAAWTALRIELVDEYERESMFMHLTPFGIARDDTPAHSLLGHLGQGEGCTCPAPRGTVLQYNSTVVLVDPVTGLRSRELIVRRVDRGSYAVVGDGVFLPSSVAGSQAAAVYKAVADGTAAHIAPPPAPAPGAKRVRSRVKDQTNIALGGAPCHLYPLPNNPWEVHVADVHGWRPSIHGTASTTAGDSAVLAAVAASRPLPHEMLPNEQILPRADPISQLHKIALQIKSDRDYPGAYVALADNRLGIYHPPIDVVSFSAYDLATEEFLTRADLALQSAGSAHASSQGGTTGRKRAGGGRAGGAGSRATAARERAADRESSVASVTSVASVASTNPSLFRGERYSASATPTPSTAMLSAPGTPLTPFIPLDFAAHMHIDPTMATSALAAAASAASAHLQGMPPFHSATAPQLLATTGGHPLPPPPPPPVVEPTPSPFSRVAIPSLGGQVYTEPQGMLLVDVTDHCVWTIVGVQRQRTELSVRPPERNLRHWCSTRPRSLFSSVRDEFFDDRIAGGMRNSGDTDSLGTPMAVRDRRHSISEPESVQGMVISGADTMAGPPAVPDDWDLRAPRSMVLVPAPRLDLHALPQLVNLPQFDSVSIAGIPDDAAFDYGHDERMSVHLSLVGKRFPVDDPEQMQLFLADIPVRLQMLSSTHAVAELPSARTVRSLVVITSGGGAYGSHGVTPTAATNGYAVSALDEQFNPAGSQVDVHYEHGDRVETVRARHSQFLATPAQLRAELSDEALETAALLAAQSSAPGSRHFITAANHRYVLRASERLLGMAVRFPGQLGMPIDDVSPLSAANGGTQSQQQQQLMPPPPLAPMHHVHHHQRPNQHLHPHRPAALDLNGLATSRGAYSAAPASYGGSPVESGPLSPLAGAGIGGGNSNAFASPLHSPPPLPGATTTWTQRRPLPPPTHGNTAGPFARYEPVPPPPVPPQQPELRRPPPVRVADLTTIAPLPASQLLPVEQIDGPVLKLPLMWARKDGLLVELGRTVVYSLALGEDDGLLQFV